MSWLSDIFSPKKRDVSLGGTTPFQSLTEIPVGKELNQVILQGLAGKGLGFDPSFITRGTSPVVAQREARFQEEELPFLSSEMSARGLGRSTIAGESLRRAGAQKERDINQILAEAYQKQEIQKAQDRARIQDLAKQWTGMEAAQKSAAAQDEMARRGYQIGTEQARDAAEQQNLNQMIGGALAVGAAPFTGGQSLTALPYIFSGVSGSAKDWFTDIDRAEKTKTIETEQATKKGAFTKSYQPFQGAYDYLRNLA